MLVAWAEDIVVRAEVNVEDLKDVKRGLMR